MKRIGILILLCGMTALAPVALANPDGPVGSMILVSRYVGDSGEAVDSAEQTNWQFGIGLEVPVSSFLTLGFEAGRVHYQTLAGSTSEPGPSEFVTIGSRLRTHFGVSARLFIPFTKAAREALGR